MPRTLSEGTTGSDVRMLQAVLNYHRVAPTDDLLTADGIFGSKTKKRVKSFQAQNQLPADGIVGPNTAKALMTICRFSAQYVATHTDAELVVGGGPGQGPTTTHYELKEGLKLTLNPWAAPPAKLSYVLEFDASWVIKNPNLPGQLSLSVGADIGTIPIPIPKSPDAPYTFSGGGRVLGKFEKDYTLGPIKLDAGVQAGFEAEYEAHSHHVELSSQLSLATGISFAVVRNRFYLNVQGDLGVVVDWFPGTVQASPQLEGTAFLEFKF